MSYANRYTATHKQWDHVGNLFPNVEHAEKGPHGRLAGDFIPAPWLPVQLFDKHFESYTVCSPGKLVALTRQGEAIPTGLGDWEDSQHVVPAGIAVDFLAGGVGITYSALDVAALTIDITTGLPVAGAVTYNANTITPLLRSRGLIRNGEIAADFISRPVGVAAHAFYQWAGARLGSKFNPADLKQHNYRVQHQVQILANYQLRLPHVPTRAHTLAVPNTLSAGPAVFGSDNMYAGADVAALLRYSGAGAFYPITNANVIGLALQQFPVATSPRTGAGTVGHPVTETAAGALVRERASVNDLVQAGDWWLDREVGMLFFYQLTGAGAVAANIDNGGGTNTLAWSDYSVPAGAVSNYASAVGDLWPGSLLTVNADSNFELVAPGVGLLPASATTNATFATTVTMINQSAGLVVGQVIGFKTYPKDLLHRVKSQYTNLGNLNAMPGTATKGLPETLTFSLAADREVVINLLNR